MLAAAAALKVAKPGEAAAALAELGVVSAPLRGAAVAAAAVLELALAVGVAAGDDRAAYAAAGMMAAFALALAAAVRAGLTGARCACFGPRSRVGIGAVARNAALAAAFAALPSLPGLSLGAEAWLTAGLAIALAGVLVLGVAVLALAREIGELRLRLPPESALEVLAEGPEIGERTRLLDRFALGRRTRFALAVFTSEGCRVCRSLAPAVAAIARDPLLAVETFDEQRDAGVWTELAVPGSPYAVAIDVDGTVRAKGTFNSAAQLESIVGAAERRAREAAGG